MEVGQASQGLCSVPRRRRTAGFHQIIAEPWREPVPRKRQIPHKADGGGDPHFEGHSRGRPGLRCRDFFVRFEPNYFALNSPLMSRLPFFRRPATTNSNQCRDPDLAVHTMPTCGVPAGGHRPLLFIRLGRRSLCIESIPISWTPGWLQGCWPGSIRIWRQARNTGRSFFLHHPPYPTGTTWMINPIVEKHNVPLVLSGHEHGYERLFPLAGCGKRALLRGLRLLPTL